MQQILSHGRINKKQMALAQIGWAILAKHTYEFHRLQGYSFISQLPKQIDLKMH